MATPRATASPELVILEPRINGLAFESQDAENGFMNAAQRFLVDESLQSFDTKRKFAKRQRAFGRKPPRTKSFQIFIGGVFRTVNNAEIFAAAALDSRLNQATLVSRDELHRFDYHSFPAARGQLLPPRNTFGFTGWSGHVNDAEWSGDNEAASEASQRLHMPVRRLVGVHF